MADGDHHHPLVTQVAARAPNNLVMCFAAQVACRPGHCSTEMSSSILRNALT